MPVKVISKGVGVSPRRVRPILDLIRGKRVNEALNILAFATSPWARIVSKVVRSASASAENNLLMEPDDLRIVEVYADGGPTLKRFRPEARGRAGRITKRTSHITVIVDEEVPSGA
jgi:large subunit ribosomal protein L22